jgi:hypothetical protein
VFLIKIHAKPDKATEWVQKQSVNRWKPRQRNSGDESPEYSASTSLDTSIAGLEKGR